MMVLHFKSLQVNKRGREGKATFKNKPCWQPSHFFHEKAVKVTSARGGMPQVSGLDVQTHAQANIECRASLVRAQRTVSVVTKDGRWVAGSLKVSLDFDTTVRCSSASLWSLSPCPERRREDCRRRGETKR